ncbi:LysR family transcriptional regulator [bacterium]|nr:LysR family transcriptional regulator [bacterium]
MKAPFSSLQNISLESIKIFEAAARHLSFTTAAKELYITQSAVSKQVKLLERRLSADLFVRKHRSLALTLNGETLYKTSHQILEQLNQSISSLCDNHQQVLNVSCNISFATLWLLPRVHLFNEIYPDIELYISVDNDLIELNDQKIDLAIRSTFAEAPDHLPCTQLFHERYLMESVDLSAIKNRPTFNFKEDSQRSYYLILAPHSVDNKAALLFQTWIQKEVQLFLPKT